MERVSFSENISDAINYEMVVFSNENEQLSIGSIFD